MSQEFNDVSFLIQAIGVCSAVGGVWNLVSIGRDADVVEAMEETPTTPVAEVRPAGYFEVKGRVGDCEALVAPRCRDEVIFFRYRQVEEWEQQGKNKTWQRFETVHKVESQRVESFRVEDESGSIEVLTEGAQFEGKRLARDVVPASSTGGGGGFGLTGRYRNHKYVHEVEGALAEGASIYVIGPTRRGPDDQPLFRQDPDEERPFLVSARSEEELSQRKHEGMAVRKIFMWLCFLVALLCLVVGFYLPPDASL